MNNKIIIRGEKQLLSPDAQDTDVLELVHSFKVSGSTRGQSETHEIDLEDDSVVELVFEDDTTWLCNKNTLGEVFPEATVRGVGDSFEIPAALEVSDDRNLVGKILVKVINVFSKKKLGKELGKKIKQLASNLEKRILE